MGVEPVPLECLESRFDPQNHPWRQKEHCQSSKKANKTDAFDSQNSQNYFSKKNSKICQMSQNDACAIRAFFSDRFSHQPPDRSHRKKSVVNATFHSSVISLIIVILGFFFKIFYFWDLFFLVLGFFFPIDDLSMYCLPEMHLV